ncbi:MAG TPA: TonB-dependent receptor [Gemmatimonadaceae bacterium]|nr:TonB-dependent receptor [Gemmatimonadaceae bacterium]
MSLRAFAATLAALTLVATASTRLAAQQSPAPPPAHPDRTPPPNTAALRVHVSVLVNGKQEPVYGAQIILLDRADTVRTDTTGVYLWRSLRPGWETVVVRALGFAPAKALAHLQVPDTTTVSFTLSPVATELATVVVTTTRKPWLLIPGWEQRRENGNGYSITAQDIAAHPANRSVDLLRRRPGFHLIPYRSSYVIRGRGRCEPLVFVDGVPVQSEIVGDQPPRQQVAPELLREEVPSNNTVIASILDTIDPDQILAIELYPGLAGLPPEYARLPLAQCGVILVWLKKGKDKDDHKDDR